MDFAGGGVLAWAFVRASSAKAGAVDSRKEPYQHAIDADTLSSRHRNKAGEAGLL